MRVLVPGTPLPQGSKRIGTYQKDGVVHRSIIDNNPRLAQWRLQVTSYVREAMADDPLRLDRGEPAAVHIAFYFPRPQSHYGTGRNAGVIKPSAPDYPTSPPDIDKLIRAILDGITDAGVWNDDAQVVTCRASKRWARKSAGCEIIITKEDYAYVAL